MSKNFSFSEENYLKAIWKLSGNNETVSTNELALELCINPASVSEMLKRLSTKNLIKYKKHGGTKLSETGHSKAIEVVRKHRLWEVFLSKKLGFAWDKIHDIAEQLEHIQSVEMIDRLDDFLDNPEFDPHGDPIPDKHGKETKIENLIQVDEATINMSYKISQFRNTNTSFLSYLDKFGIKPGAVLKMKEQIDFDQSVIADINGKTCHLSREASQNILIQEYSYE